jgi:hypothetical protein
MKNLNLTLIALIASAGLMGCAKSTSSDVMAKPEEVVQGKATGGTMQVEFNPAVDILFVVDNSNSMEKAQGWLREGIAEFVDGFGENSSVDYRAGVITVYDTGRCGRVYKGQVRDCYPAGQLQPIKTIAKVDVLDAEGKPVFEADGKTIKKQEKFVAGQPGFVSRGEGSAAILKATLDVGSPTLDEGGPQFEEMFMPVLEALKPSMNNGPNKGFIRNDSQVVIIFVSDENDGSAISTDMFVPTVQAALSNPKMNGSDRLTMHGVLAVGGCKPGKIARPPSRLVKVIKEVNGDTYPICNPTEFANGLKKIGKNIRERMMRSSFVLNGRPARGSIKVFYGDVELKSGWKYVARTNTIEISSNLPVQPKPGAKFSATFDRVSDNAVNKGHSTAVVY